MQRVIVFSFCLVSCFALNWDETDGDYELADRDVGRMRDHTDEDISQDRSDSDNDHNDLKKDSGLDVDRYKVELAAGDPSEFRSNVHYHVPHYYENFARRFVPVYPYKERKSSKKGKKHEDKDIIPIQAPPEVVLAVMKKAIKSHPLPKPSGPTEEVIRQQMLRSGDYWDGVWKEEVNPESLLRTNKNKIRASDEEVDTLPITAKLVPGSKLYDLIAGAVRHSPRLLYIINDD